MLVVLSAHNQLYYYQGFHDVASVFLLVMAPESDTLALSTESVQSAFKWTSRGDIPIQLVPAAHQSITPHEIKAYYSLCQTVLYYLRPCCDSNLHGIILYLSCLYPLLSELCPDLAVFLRKTGVEPFFALSWVICWCSHDLDDINNQKRIFDFFLVSSPWMSLYFTATVLILNKDSILQLENEHSLVHTFLSKLLKRSFEKRGEEEQGNNKKRLGQVIRDSVKYFEQFNSQKLISKCKVQDIFQEYPFHWMGVIREIEVQKRSRRERNEFILYSVLGLFLALIVFVFIELYRNYF